MDHDSEPSVWPVQTTLMQLSNGWLTLIGERLITPDQHTVDYWRVEKADSAIVVPVWRGQVVVPPGLYRPGLGEVTLDLPGGRIAPDPDPSAAPTAGQTAAQRILQRELGVEAGAIALLTPLNTIGWPINSSFSNQRLFGFRAELESAIALPFPQGSQYFPFTLAGLQALLQHITCLQCRAVLLEVLLHLSTAQA
jgi:hypothetical protein